MDEPAQTAYIQEYKVTDRCQPFNFANPPLMRLALIRLSDDLYKMIWTRHHLVMDGWSGQVLMREFFQTYEALLSGKVIPAVTPDRYEDYIRYIAKQNKEHEEKYWRKYLKGTTNGVLLPFAKTDGAGTRGVSAFRDEMLTVDADTTRQIIAYAQQHRITVNTIMQGVWAWLLYRYTGLQNILYGVTVSGRPAELPDMEERVGLYVNTLPLHAIINEEQQLHTWLQTIQQGQLYARTYQYTSLTDIQQWAGIKGELFDTILIYQNYPISRIAESYRQVLQVQEMEVHEQTTNYVLCIRIVEEERIGIQFVYKSDQLDTSSVQMIKEHFAQVLSAIIDPRTQKTKDLWGIGGSALTVKKPQMQQEDLFDFESR
jgi:hypothetical protein